VKSDLSTQIHHLLTQLEQKDKIISNLQNQMDKIHKTMLDIVKFKEDTQRLQETIAENQLKEKERLELCRIRICKKCGSEFSKLNDKGCQYHSGQKEDLSDLKHLRRQFGRFKWSCCEASELVNTHLLDGCQYASHHEEKKEKDHDDKSRDKDLDDNSRDRSKSKSVDKSKSRDRSKSKDD